MLTWHSPARLPVGGAAPEFRIGAQLIGYPTISADLHTLSLRLPDSTAIDVSAVQVWLSGTRLDASSPVRTAPPRSPYSPSVAGRALGVDPGERGPWSTTSSDYVLDPVVVPDLPLAVPTIGHVVAGNREVLI